MLLLLIVDDKKFGGLPGHLQRFSHHSGDDLAMIGDTIRLQDCHAFIFNLGEPWGILMGKDSNDAGQGEGVADVNRDNSPSGDRALDRIGIGDALYLMLIGIGGGSSDLPGTIDAVERCSNSPYFNAHDRFSSPARS